MHTQAVPQIPLGRRTFAGTRLAGTRLAVAAFLFLGLIFPAKYPHFPIRRFQLGDKRSAVNVYHFGQLAVGNVDFPGLLILKTFLGNFLTGGVFVLAIFQTDDFIPQAERRAFDARGRIQLVLQNLIQCLPGQWAIFIHGGQRLHIPNRV